MNAVDAQVARQSPTRFAVLLGAVIVQLILGTVYGYSIFWRPLSGEVFPEVITAAEWADRTVGASAGEVATGDLTVVADSAERAGVIAKQQGRLKYAFSICILSFALVMVFAGRVQDVTGPRIPALVGACLLGVGFLMAGLMRHGFIYVVAHAVLTAAVAAVLITVWRKTAHDVLKAGAKAGLVGAGVIAVVCVAAGILVGGKYVGTLGTADRLLLLWGTIGLLAGAGIGFAYVCPIAALVKWFPKNKGLVSGVAVAGFGFGAYLFKGRGIGALGYIEQHGITDFFLVHAAVCFVGVGIGALLLRNPPAMAHAGAAHAESAWRATLKRPAFYVLWLMFFSGAMAGLMVIGIVAVFAGEQLVAAASEGGRSLVDADRAALLAKGAAAVGWLAIFNAVGRIVWGFVSDMVGRTRAFVAMFLLQAVMMFLLGTMHTELTLAVAASIVGFNFGGNFALFPSATADLFGAKNLGANYGWVFTSYGIAGVVGIAAGNTAKVMTGSYGAAFTVAACMCLVSAGLAVGLAMSGKKRAAPTPALAGA
ncbi:MAG: MFS transporter [Phycisphaerales bacterium]|nr:MFS transporter [Phycisphaerales bacterium]